MRRAPPPRTGSRKPSTTKAIAKRIIEFVSGSEFRLVETLADRTAALVREEFGAPWVRLRINKKYAIRGAADVGVVVERGERAA